MGDAGGRSPSTEALAPVGRMWAPSSHCPAAEAQSVMGSAGPEHVEPVIVPMLEVTGAVTDLQAGGGQPGWRGDRKSD
jgi:hypothetical protein